MAAWIAVVALALILAAIGISLAGSPAAFREWMVAATPYALVWRLAIYIGGGTFYLTRVRPRLRVMQQRMPDGGRAAHRRLLRIERLMLVVFVAIELTNAPDLIAWIRD